MYMHIFHMAGDKTRIGDVGELRAGYWRVGCIIVMKFETFSLKSKGSIKNPNYFDIQLEEIEILGWKLEGTWIIKFLWRNW